MQMAQSMFYDRILLSFIERLRDELPGYTDMCCVL